MVADKLAETAIGAVVIGAVFRLSDLGGEVMEDCLGVDSALSNDQDVSDSPSPYGKMISEDLQEVSFSGLPADE